MSRQSGTTLNQLKRLRAVDGNTVFICVNDTHRRHVLSMLRNCGWGGVRAGQPVRAENIMLILPDDLQADKLRGLDIKAIEVDHATQLAPAQLECLEEFALSTFRSGVMWRMRTNDRSARVLGYYEENAL